MEKPTIPLYRLIQETQLANHQVDPENKAGRAGFVLRGW